MFCLPKTAWPPTCGDRAGADGHLGSPEQLFQPRHVKNGRVEKIEGIIEQSHKTGAVVPPGSHSWYGLLAIAGVLQPAGLRGWRG